MSDSVEPDGELSGAESSATEGSGGERSVSLAGMPVTVWAELGRTALSAGKFLNLPLGSVVELDCPASEPVDLFVDGLRFATGRLVVAEDEQWAIRIEEVLS